MRKFSPYSILSETSDNIARDTVVAFQDYVVHKKREIIQVTTFIHVKLEETVKEKEEN